MVMVKVRVWVMVMVRVRVRVRLPASPHHRSSGVYLRVVQGGTSSNPNVRTCVAV